MPNKINVKKNKDFFKFLIDVSRKKSVNPIFSNIKVVFDSRGTTWFATDGEISYFFTEEAVNEDLGSCVFNGNMFWNFLKKVKSDEILVSWNKSFFNVFDNKNNASLKLFTHDFEFKDKNNFEILCTMNTDKIRMVVESALLPVNDTNGGVLSLIVKNDSLSFLARDYRRLSLSKINIEGDFSKSFVITARQIIMEKLLDFCSKYDTIQLYSNDSEYMIQQNGEYLIFKKLTADNLNYESLCNNLNCLEYKCSLDDIKHALEFVSIMCSKLNHTVELIFNGNELTLQVIDPNQGKCVRSVDGSGEVYGSIYINTQYFLEALSLKNDDDVYLYYKSKESKFIMKSGIVTHVIMPIVR